MGLSNELSCEAGSFSCCCNPHRFLQLEVLKALFHLTGALGLQPLPCRESSPPGCLSLPLLLVWMNVSSLTPWILDFHTVHFSVSPGCFLFLNLLLSFFWLCEEAKYIYLCLYLGQKFSLFIYS